MIRILLKNLEFLINGLHIQVDRTRVCISSGTLRVDDILFLFGEEKK